MIIIMEDVMMIALEVEKDLIAD